MYSSPTQYLKALEDECYDTQLEYSNFQSDFIPITSFYEEQYWSGFYSSRPNFKRLLRFYSNFYFQMTNLYTPLLFSDNDMT